MQRRKKYKSRTILGYKTLAEGIIRMDAVLQKSMDMTVELTASGKSGRQGCTVATLRADRVSSIPVDHDNKNNNSVVLAGWCSFLLSISFIYLCSNFMSLLIHCPEFIHVKNDGKFIDYYEIDELLEK